MAIVNMTKFDLFSFEEDRKAILDELQKFKDVHFSDTTSIAETESIEKISLPVALDDLNEKINEYQWMIDVLENRTTAKTGIKALKEGLLTVSFEQLASFKSSYDLDKLYEELSEYEKEISKLNEEKNNHLSSVGELTVWDRLDYKLSDIESTGQTRIMIGTIPAQKLVDLNKDLLSLDYTYIDEVSVRKGLASLLIITHKKEEEKALDFLKLANFQRANIPGDGKPQEEIEKHNLKIKEIEDRIDDINKKIKEKLFCLDDLKLAYEQARNEKLKLAASENFLKLRDVNIIEGYIPTDRLGEFENLLKNNCHNYYLETKEAEKGNSEVPVMLKNGKFVDAFESITTMYAVPKYDEIDPTPFFAFFYWFFFGMMVADFGYGIVMTIACAVAYKLFNLDYGMKNFVKFFLFLGISTTIWGLIYGSAFGVALPFKLIDTSNTTNLLIISVAFGGVHLFFGMAVKAYMLIRDGHPLDAVYDVLFWYMALIGAIVLLLSSSLKTIPPIAGTISKWVMIVGMIGIVLFGARETKNPAARLAGGLYSLYGMSSWIGDFVSYSRLMALGLSGGFIAVAVNMIITMISGSAVGMVFGALIFIGGHLFNAFLSYLSAYVHTARLTYVEFFGKFYEGGGKVFNLFREKPKYINIK